MRRHLALGLAVVPAFVLLTACAPMIVSSHHQRGLDFTAYRSYDWGPADALPTGDPRLDQDPFFQDHMQGAVERHLAAKGFERMGSATAPDLLIHYHANISRRIDVDHVDVGYGYRFDSGSRVIEYEAGTLVLDIVDNRTKKVIWRGWARHGVTDMLDDRDAMARKIEEAVRRMLERFPPPS